MNACRPSHIAEKSFCLELANSIVDALRATETRDALVTLMEAVTREMGFRYYILAHHYDLRERRSGYSRLHLRR